MNTAPLRRVTGRLGLHPVDPDARSFDLSGRRALLVATNHADLGNGKRTGVFCSEFSVPYYLFADAGIAVDLASPSGGVIPVDPLSIRPVVRCAEDDRLLADNGLRAKMSITRAVSAIAENGEGAAYDIVFLAGGWGAAFDFATCDALGQTIVQAFNAGAIVGGICHGPLGFCTAVNADGSPFVKGRKITSVTDRQIKQLRIESTPFHPETEMRRLGARFEFARAFRDPLANHWVVDGRVVTGQNQNAGPMVAREMMTLVEQAARSTDRAAAATAR